MLYSCVVTRKLAVNKAYCLHLFTHKAKTVLDRQSLSQFAKELAMQSQQSFLGLCESLSLSLSRWNKRLGGPWAPGPLRGTLRVQGGRGVVHWSGNSVMHRELESLLAVHAHIKRSITYMYVSITCCSLHGLLIQNQRFRNQLLALFLDFLLYSGTKSIEKDSLKSALDYRSFRNDKTFDCDF